MAEAVTASIEVMTLDELQTQHRREKKELQAKIQALKKNAPKNKRKEAMEEVARLENELEKRHEAEIKSASNKTKNATTNDLSENQKNANVNNNEENDPIINSNNEIQEQQQQQQQQQKRVSKAQKRRDKKARENKEREEAFKAILEDNRYNAKNAEANLFETQLKTLKLALCEVPSDGDCLYNAVRQQLMQRGFPSYTVQQLREETANYIEANKAALHCYMTNPKTGDLLTDEEFIEYCEAVRSTPAWGGEVELKALSTVLRIPIEVLQANAPSTIHGADEFNGPNLIITYHRHLFSLGEHYNSTRPLESNELDDHENYEN